MSRQASSRLLSFFATSALAFPLLTGCGIGHIDTTTPSAGFHGKVFGGQQPIAQSTISVWQAGTASYGAAASSTPLATVQSDNNGNFSFPSNAYTCPAPTTQVYITAAGGDPTPGVPNPNVLLAAGLGNCSTAKSQFVIINEVTTAATAYAMAQFFDPDFTASGASSFGSTAGDAKYLALSNTHTIPMLVDLPSGTARPSSDGVTREDAFLNTMANILAACVNDASLCTTLFNDTKNISSVAPKNTLQAAVSMALRPTQNVGGLYNLSTGTPPFTGLPSRPNDFLLSLAYTSPNFGLSINSAYPGGSSSNIDIATDGRVFFPSNAPGKTGIGVFDPSLGSFGSLLVPNTLTLPQYVAIDDVVGNIFATDLGSGSLALVTSDYSESINHSIDTDTASSAAIALISNVFAVSETTTSGTNKLTLTSPGFSTRVLTTLTAPATGIAASGANFYAITSGAATPCYLEEVDAVDEGTTYTDQVVAETFSNCRSGGIFSTLNLGYGMATTANQDCRSTNGCGNNPSLNAPQAIAYDGAQNIWIANSGDASLYFDGGEGAILYSHPDTLFKPYGLAIDGSGNLWLSNAGCLTTTTTPCDPGSFTLTEFIGAAAPTITPMSAQSAGSLSGTEPQ